MKKSLALFLLMAVNALGLMAQQITFVPQWTPQAQFAGFYAAYEKGFYAAAGLDVNISHLSLNSKESSANLLANGDCNIAGMQIMQGITRRADGTRLVNVMQITQTVGLCCLAHTPIKTPSDLNGFKIAKWLQGYSEICEIIAAREGMDVDWTYFFNSSTNLFIYGAVDATLCYSFSELIRLYQAMGSINEDNLIRFGDFYQWPEDGLYVTEDYYQKNKETIDKFVDASIRGWNWAADNRDEAIKIVMRYTSEAHISTNVSLERMMLDEYLRLQENPRTGKRDYSAVTPETFSQISEELYNHGFANRLVEYRELIR